MKALLPVLLPSPATPIRRYIDTLFLFAIALLLGAMHRRRLVLRLRVDGVQNQGCGARVEELMLRASRDDHQVAGVHLLLLAADLGEARTRGEGEDLVDGMGLGIKSVHVHCAWDGMRTSSPMSPPSGMVMMTSCEYSPVQSTRRKSDEVDGRLVVMRGKCCISCFGGSLDGVLRGAMDPDESRIV